LTATDEVGVFGGDGHTPFTYVTGELAWEPNDDFTASIAAEANTDGGYKLTTTAEKTFD